jgi:peptidoglycan/LPS O-acetylase OafA/YrhL
MTATVTPATPSPTLPATPSLWRPGLVAGVAAAAATVALAAVAHASGVSLETAPGKAIPAIGFGQLTLFFTAVGVLIARTIRRRAGQPRSTFTRTAVVLTALSVVPDVVLSTDTATKLTLVLTHLVAAAIVIPALSSRLPELGTRR